LCGIFSWGTKKLTTIIFVLEKTLEVQTEND